MWLLSLVGFCLIFSFAYSDDKLQCKDEDGNSVDWLVMYKINAQSKSSDSLIKKGEGYVYITSATVDKGWQLTKKGVASDSAILSHTLSPIYNKAGDKSIRVLYNDHIPGTDKARGNHGHAKGVVIANENEGFWLIHSVPAFPPSPPKGKTGKYSFPDSGKKYGQSFMCISVKSNQIETIGLQVYFNQAIVYYSKASDALQKKYPTLAKVAKGTYKNDKPYLKKVSIKSAAGVDFTSFAKSDSWNQELYHDAVAPQLGSPLNVQTWRSGSGKLNSDCKGTAVYNINSVEIKISKVTIGVINSNADHSKFAVSKDAGSKGNWVCVGDINRVDTQKKRGGGTLCVKLPQLWKSYSSIVKDVEKCK